MPFAAEAATLESLLDSIWKHIHECSCGEEPSFSWLMTSLVGKQPWDPNTLRAYEKVVGSKASRRCTRACMPTRVLRFARYHDSSLWTYSSDLGLRSFGADGIGRSA